MKKTNRSIVSWILRVFKGAAIGMGAILPGISGGALSVVFGIYQPLMDFFAHPLKKLKKYILFFIPLGLGFGLGVLGLAKLVGFLFADKDASTPAIWLFVGLIIGTFPGLFREAGKQGRSAKSYVAFACGMVFTIGLAILSKQAATQITPNFGWWIFSGVMWGLGIIVPGLSPSSILIFLGLYGSMSAGIGSLDMGIIIPIAIGLIATILLLAKGVQKLLEIAYSVTFHIILGVVAGSTFAIVPPWQGGIGLPVNAACFFAGVVVTLLMGRMEESLPSAE